MNIEQARELLPWYATGSLQPDEARAVAAQVAENKELALELEELRLLHDAVAEEGAEEPEFRPQLIQEALQRIDALEAEQTAPVARDTASPEDNARDNNARENNARENVVPITAAPRASGRLRRWAASIQWQATPVFARAAMVGQLALITLLATAVLQREPADQVSQTLSGPEVAAPAVGPRWRVAFNDEVSEQQLRQLLQDNGLQIVAGPSALGIYTVAPVDGSATDDSRYRTLQQSAMIRYVAHEVKP